MIGFANEIVSVAADGTALANSAVLTSLLPATLVPAINVNSRASFFNYVGQELLVEAAGRISTLVTAPGTLTFAFRMGPTKNISVAVSQPLALNVVAKVNVTWRLRWELSLRAVGAAANFLHTGVFTSEAVVGSPLPTVGGAGVLPIPASAPAVGTNFSSLVLNQFDLQAQWSVADPANSIQLQQFRIISPN